MKKVKSLKIFIIVIIISIAFILGYNVGANTAFPIPSENYRSNENDLENLNTQIFKNKNIQLSYSPKLFNFNYEIFNNPPDGPEEKKTQIITLSAKNSINNKLIIKINMYGLGGGCPDFPKDYQIYPFTLDGKEVYKAKYIKYINDPKKYNPSWPSGNIYFVEKTKNGWSCPNVSGLRSIKNGAAWIEYSLIEDSSLDKTQIEKEFDNVVSSIKYFWN